VYYTFTSNMKALGLDRTVIPFPISSDQGFDVLRSYQAGFDLIYVDASHEEQAVLRDIENAWSILSPGGILAGDDYDLWPGVTKAVGGFISGRGLQGVVDGRLWMIPKPLETLQAASA
jgi:predicted O-methyltransferase YrrM